MKSKGGRDMGRSSKRRTRGRKKTPPLSQPAPAPAPAPQNLHAVAAVNDASDDSSSPAEINDVSPVAKLDDSPSNSTAYTGLQGELDPYWNPQKKRRVSRVEGPSVASQRRKKNMIKPVFPKDSEEDKDYFSEILANPSFASSLAPKQSGERSKAVKARTTKAYKEYAQHLEKRYGPIDNNTASFCQQHNMVLPSEGEAFKHEEIRKIRFEPPTAAKPNKSFSIFCGTPESKTAYKEVSIEYVRHYLGAGFVNRCVQFGELCAKAGLKQHGFLVPLGDSNLDVAPQKCLSKLDDKGNPRKKMPFVQGESNCCLGFSLANALHHLGFKTEATALHTKSHDWSELDATAQFKSISHWVHSSNNGIACLSVKHSKKFDGIVGFEQAIQSLKEHELVLFVPQAGDGTNTHAVAYTQGLIFDPTQEYPLRLSAETLTFIAGCGGFKGIWRARLFTLNNTRK